MKALEEKPTWSNKLIYYLTHIPLFMNDNDSYGNTSLNVYDYYEKGNYNRRVV